ncbi:DUF4123 domain-containing protein [Jeongeupia sp. USM3]|uniref:DUF4123 domain-containing protein n=1 Tax=Jeongeupia sp. USM3 TaxID=1906741 RepID=UPI00089E0AD3|nr:DUF4123 domain-containing protein [Jeongeupia sp. USM3]AOX99932.1 hypothetical protein BJP62_05335 [Jeongeupia sp. USM3]
MMKASLLSSSVTPESWVAALWQHAVALDLAHVHIVLDQAGLDSSWKKGLQADVLMGELLADTQHAEAASEGAVLFRIPVISNGPSPALVRLFERVHQQSRLLVLMSDWHFTQLLEYLKFHSQVQWEGGKKQGVLRFCNPWLFPVVSTVLTPKQQAVLHSAAYEWHWIDRDGDSMMLASAHAPIPESIADGPISLDQEQIDMLSAWHQAELWRQSDLIVPGDCGVTTQEELMRKLVNAQIEADKMEMWSQAPRLVFLRQQVGLH